ncbi:MAG: hypothetical protein ACYDD1_06830 [Caulobacteraceae bacterium]
MEEGREEQLAVALTALLDYAEAQICLHEDLKRGGVLWTICGQCGRKWADDEGGFTPDAEPPEITKAREALAAFRSPTPAGGGREAQDADKAALIDILFSRGRHGPGRDTCEILADRLLEAGWRRSALSPNPSPAVALNSAEAERRRQEPTYKLIQRVDHFLHDAMEVPALKDRAAELHAEIHEAAFQYVTEGQVEAPTPAAPESAGMFQRPDDDPASYQAAKARASAEVEAELAAERASAIQAERIKGLEEQLTKTKAALALRRTNNDANVQRAESRALRLSARLDALKGVAQEALDPFARIYAESVKERGGVPSRPRPDDQFACGFNDGELLWGDFARAASALANLTQEEGTLS